MISDEFYLYIFRAPPYSSGCGQEGLDAVLSALSFDLNVKVLFIDDGVFQIKQGQLDYSGATNKERGRMKQYTKAFKALSDMGVNNMYVDERSCIARGLDEKSFIVNVIALEYDAVSKLVGDSTRVFIF